MTYLQKVVLTVACVLLLASVCYNQEVPQPVSLNEAGFQPFVDITPSAANEPIVRGMVASKTEEAVFNSYGLANGRSVVFGGNTYTCPGPHFCVLLIKMSLANEILWTYLFPNSYQGDMVATIDGGIIYAGTLFSPGFRFGNYDFRSPPCGSNCREVFLAKLDKNGNVVWGKMSSSASNANQRNINLLEFKDGSLVLAYGLSGGHTFFDGKYYAKRSGHNELVLFRLTPLGTVTLVKDIYSPSVSFTDMVAHTDNSIYLSGAYNNYVYAEGYNTPYSSVTTAFIIKMNSQFKVQWGVVGSGVSNSQTNRIKLDSNGDVIAVGHFSAGTFTVGTFAVNSVGSNSNHYLMKLTSTGSVYYLKAFGSNGEFVFTSISDAPDALIYVAGYMKGSNIVIGELTPFQLNYRAAFVMKLDTEGEIAQILTTTGKLTDELAREVLYTRGQLLLRLFNAGEVMYEIIKSVQSAPVQSFDVEKSTEHWLQTNGVNTGKVNFVFMAEDDAIATSICFAWTNTTSRVFLSGIKITFSNEQAEFVGKSQNYECIPMVKDEKIISWNTYGESRNNITGSVARVEFVTNTGRKYISSNRAVASSFTPPIVLQARILSTGSQLQYVSVLTDGKVTISYSVQDAEKIQIVRVGDKFALKSEMLGKFLAVLPNNAVAFSEDNISTKQLFTFDVMEDVTVIKSYLGTYLVYNGGTVKHLDTVACTSDVFDLTVAPNFYLQTNTNASFVGFSNNQYQIALSTPSLFQVLPFGDKYVVRDSTGKFINLADNGAVSALNSITANSRFTLLSLDQGKVAFKGASGYLSTVNKTLGVTATLASSAEFTLVEESNKQAAIVSSYLDFSGVDLKGVYGNVINGEIVSFAPVFKKMAEGVDFSTRSKVKNWPVAGDDTGVYKYFLKSAPVSKICMKWIPPTNSSRTVKLSGMSLVYTNNEVISIGNTDLSDCFSFKSNEYITYWTTKSARVNAMESRVGQITFMTNLGNYYSSPVNVQQSAKRSRICLGKKGLSSGSVRFIDIAYESSIETNTCQKKNEVTIEPLNGKITLRNVYGLYLNAVSNGSVVYTPNITDDALFTESMIDNIASYRTRYGTFLSSPYSLLQHSLYEQITKGDDLVRSFVVSEFCLKVGTTTTAMNTVSLVPSYQQVAGCSLNSQITLIPYKDKYVIQLANKNYLRANSGGSFSSVNALTDVGVYFSLAFDGDYVLFRTFFNTIVVYESGALKHVSELSASPLSKLTLVEIDTLFKSDFTMSDANGVKLHGIFGSFDPVKGALTSLALLTQPNIVTSTASDVRLVYEPAQGDLTPLNLFTTRTSSVSDICFNWGASEISPNSTVLRGVFMKWNDNSISILGRNSTTAPCFKFEANEKVTYLKIKGQKVNDLQSRVGHVIIATSKNRTFVSGNPDSSPLAKPKICLQSYGLSSNNKPQFITTSGSEGYLISDKCQDNELVNVIRVGDKVLLYSEAKKSYLTAINDNSLKQYSRITENAYFTITEVGGYSAIISSFGKYLVVFGGTFMQQVEVTYYNTLVFVAPIVSYCWKSPTANQFVSTASTIVQNSCGQNELFSMIRFGDKVALQNYNLFIRANSDGSISFTSVVTEEALFTLEYINGIAAIKTVWNRYIFVDGTTVRQSPTFVESKTFRFIASDDNAEGEYEKLYKEPVVLTGFHGYMFENGELGSLGLVLQEYTQTESNQRIGRLMGRNYQAINTFLQDPNVIEFCCWANSSAITGIYWKTKTQEVKYGKTFVTDKRRCLNVDRVPTKWESAGSKYGNLGWIKLTNEVSTLECGIPLADRQGYYSSIDYLFVQGMTGYVSDIIESVAPIFKNDQDTQMRTKRTGALVETRFNLSVDNKQVKELCFWWNNGVLQTLKIRWFNSTQIESRGNGYVSSCFTFFYGELITFLSITGTSNNGGKVGGLSFATSMQRSYNSGSVSSILQYEIDGVATTEQFEFFHRTGKALLGFFGAGNGDIESLGAVFRDTGTGSKSKFTFDTPIGNGYLTNNFKFLDNFSVEEICCWASPSAVAYLYMRTTSYEYDAGVAVGTGQCINVANRPITKLTLRQTTSGALGMFKLEIGTDVLTCSASANLLTRTVVQNGPRRLLGFTGRSDQVIQSLGAIWANDVKKVNIVAYSLNLDSSEIVRSPPQSITSQEVINESDVEQTVEISGEKEVSSTSSIEFSEAYSSETSVEVSLDLKASIAYKQGLGSILGLEIEAKFGLEYGFSAAQSFNNGFAQAAARSGSASQTSVYGYAVPVVVPARSKVQCEVLFYEIIKTLDWVGIAEYVYDDGTNEYTRISGKYSQTSLRYVMASIGRNYYLTYRK